MSTSTKDIDKGETVGTGPGKSPMGAGAITLVAVYLVVFSVLVLYGLVKLWPHPTPSGEPKAEVVAGATPTPAAATTPETGAATPAVATPVRGATPGVGLAASGTAPVATPVATPAATPPSSATPNPTPGGKGQLPDPELIYFFNGWFRANIYAETRLLLLVMLAGALGSLMHAVRSLFWYTGHRAMIWSWAAMYLLLPLSGAMLSVIFYFVVRGGFFSPQASFEQTSPFGFAALSALVGLFSSPATLKLKEVAETIFTKPAPGEDAKTQDSAGSSGSQTNAASPVISSITPGSGPNPPIDTVTISGTGFVSGCHVKFGGTAAEVAQATSTAITVKPPPGAGVVDVEVTNPDGQKVTLAGGFTYT